MSLLLQRFCCCKCVFPSYVKCLALFKMMLSTLINSVLQSSWGRAGGEQREHQFRGPIARKACLSKHPSKADGEKVTSKQSDEEAAQRMWLPTEEQGMGEKPARLMRNWAEKNERVRLKNPHKICAQMIELLVCAWIFWAVISYSFE